METKCKNFIVKIAGYIDGELSENQSEAVAKHLNACPDCQGQYEAEKNIKRLLTEKLPRIKAPAYLQTRVRRQLIRQGQPPGFWRLINLMFEYRPVAASFAIAVIASLIVLPTFQLLQTSTEFGVETNQTEATQIGELEGEIICLDCEFLSQNRKGVVHDKYRHRPGMRAEDNTIWTFLQTDVHGELFYNPKLLLRRAHVSGVMFANSRYIQVKDYRLL